MKAPRNSADPKVFRNQETRFMAGASALMFGAFSLFFLFVPGALLGRLALSALCGGLAVAFVVRGMRQGVYLDELGIEVRGAFRREKIPWERIARFDLRKGVRDMVTYVDLVDGSSVAARALNAGTGLLPAMRRRAQVQVDELNAILADRRRMPQS